MEQQKNKDKKGDLKSIRPRLVDKAKEVAGAIERG